MNPKNVLPQIGTDLVKKKVDKLDSRLPFTKRGSNKGATNVLTTYIYAMDRDYILSRFESRVLKSNLTLKFPDSSLETSDLSLAYMRCTVLMLVLVLAVRLLLKAQADAM
jgi:hypothetical protein